MRNSLAVVGANASFVLQDVNFRTLFLYSAPMFSVGPVLPAGDLCAYFLLHVFTFFIKAADSI